MRHRIGDIVRVSKETFKNGSHMTKCMHLKGIEGEIKSTGHLDWEILFQGDPKGTISFRDSELRLVRRNNEQN